MATVGGGRTLRMAPAALAGRILGSRVGDGLFAGGLVLEKHWKRVLGRRGTGRVYDVRLRTVGGRVIPVGPRPRHRASAPGQPPAPDRGELRGSVGTAKVGGKVRVGPGVPRPSQRGYVARILEEGVTSHPAGIVIAPRPHAQEAARRAMREMNGVVIGHLRRG